MPRTIHGFDWPDRCIVGTVGVPGSRTFYLQARERSDLVSVALEKQQSAALAGGIDQVLDELMAQDGNPFSVPATTPAELIDDEPLEEPVEERFRVGTLSLGWDPSSVQVVIEAAPLTESEDDPDLVEDDPDEVLVVRLPVGAARAFAKRTRDVVAAGRPMCPFCGMPIDSDGHICERPDDVQ